MPKGGLSYKSYGDCVASAKAKGQSSSACASYFKNGGRTNLGKNKVRRRANKPVRGSLKTPRMGRTSSSGNLATNRNRGY